MVDIWFSEGFFPNHQPVIVRSASESLEAVLLSDGSFGKTAAAALRNAPADDLPRPEERGEWQDTKMARGFHGKSHELDDLKVPPFQETSLDLLKSQLDDVKW